MPHQPLHRALALLLCLVLLPLAALADTYTPAQVPNPKTHGNGYVSNPDGILRADTVAHLDAELAALERDTGAQVAVVAVDDISPPSIFDFSQALFEHWGIGHRDRDDGLLILVVRGQRTMRMHTGYGLEGTLSDIVTKRIQEETIVPEFRRGDFDGGLIAGVERVGRLLRDPAYAQQFAAQLSPARQNWMAFRNVGVGVLGVVGLIVFGIKSMFGYFSGSRGIQETPPAMRYARWSWLAVFVAGPLLVLFATGFVTTEHPYLLSLGAVYGYFLLTGTAQIVRQGRHVKRLYARHNYTAITRFLRRQRGFWTKMAFLFPLPLLFYRLHLPKVIERYRHHSRQCPRCKAPMRLLSEAEEDAFLSAGQQMEETIHSADHDVWLCDACGEQAVRSYGGTESGFNKCPSCEHLTWFEESDKTLVEADYDHSGEGERVLACKFCDHREIEHYNIARLQRSSSSSGSSSSSSSWGGGSSGGGGSSSSW